MWNYVLIGLVIIIVGMGIEIKGLRNDNAKLLINEGVMRSQVRELGDLLETKNDILQKCSDRTKQLVEEGIKRAKEAEDARTAAREAGKKNRELADEILRFKRKPQETACDAANRLFDEYIDRGL